MEDTVKTAKTLIKKAKESGTEYYLAVLSSRNTPTEAFRCIPRQLSDAFFASIPMHSSPAQRTFERRTRTQLPTAEMLLKPHTPHTTSTRNQIIRRKAKRTHYYNTNSKKFSSSCQSEKLEISQDHQSQVAASTLSTPDQGDPHDIPQRPAAVTIRKDQPRQKHLLGLNHSNLRVGSQELVVCPSCPFT